MSIYYNYAPDGSKMVVLSYVDDCVYLYTNEYSGNGLLILWEEIPCELLGICTLVHVNNNLSIEGPFHFYGSG